MTSGLRMTVVLCVAILATGCMTFESMRPEKVTLDVVDHASLGIGAVPTTDQSP